MSATLSLVAWCTLVGVLLGAEVLPGVQGCIVIVEGGIPMMGHAHWLVLRKPLIPSSTACHPLLLFYILHWEDWPYCGLLCMGGPTIEK